jgi:hypothetical protein
LVDWLRELGLLQGRVSYTRMCEAAGVPLPRPLVRSLLAVVDAPSLAHCLLVASNLLVGIVPRETLLQHAEHRLDDYSKSARDSLSISAGSVYPACMRGAVSQYAEPCSRCNLRMAASSNLDVG